MRGTVHTLVGGSIGLEGILRRAGLSASINDLVPFRVDPWDRSTAVEFLHGLGRDIDFRLGRPVYRSDPGPAGRSRSVPRATLRLGASQCV